MLMVFKDSGEPGINGVTVNLYDSADTLVQTTTTDADGNYLFTDCCRICTTSNLFSRSAMYSPMRTRLPIPMIATRNPSDGQTITTTLVSDEDDLTWDAGLYR